MHSQAVLFSTQTLQSKGLSGTSTTFFSVYGPQRLALIAVCWGKSPTTGVPIATARCNGPVEFETNNLAERINAPNSFMLNFPTSVIGILLKKFFKIPLIYDMHSSMPQQLVNYSFTNSKALINLFAYFEK
ncbi:MAG: hypothetical protein AAB344_03990, partial [Bacteroidota bacterium]